MSLLPPGFTWLEFDTWVVVTGALTGMACAIPGVFLLLRRMSMMGDAISHAVLPGLALAFLLTGSRASLVMFIGAAIVGVLTAVFTQWVHSAGKVDEGAAMGVVFTVLFAIGLVLIVRAAHAVDLDASCVLYGSLETTPATRVDVLGWRIPPAVLTNGGMLLINALVFALFFKEFKLSTFDPELATTLGFDARVMHYLLMTLVALTTVSAFEAVGSILVIAMLVVPAAVAHLLTDRLVPMIVVACLAAAVSALLGHLGALVAPWHMGFGPVSTSTAGMTAVAAGGLLVAAVLLGPRHGLLAGWLRRYRLGVRIAAEDLLGRLYREEEGIPLESRPPAHPRMARWLARRGLRRAGKLSGPPERMQLTDRGRSAARELIRSHRLWERYLETHMPLPADHLHAPAETLEHVTGAALQRRLADEVQSPSHDPHGRPIPDESDRT